MARAAINKYCILRSSPQLREAIKLRLKTTTQAEVCRRALVYRPKLNNYLAGVQGALTQASLLRVCSVLNIHVELSIELR